MSRVEVIGAATLYLGDCRDILPTLGKVDAVVTDPPYGIGKDGQKRTTGGNGGRKAYDFLGWDSERPNQETFDLIMRAAPLRAIWGGNYFADMLPATGKWLVWDKAQRIHQSDGELCWTSLNGALRIYPLNRVELLTEGACHPTQKPVKLMLWTLSEIGDPSSVLDPFMGVGSTGVACGLRGLAFVGIEREPTFFDAACRRIEQAYKQPRLFAEPAPKPVQMAMFADGANERQDDAKLPNGMK